MKLQCQNAPVFPFSSTNTNCIIVVTYHQSTLAYNFCYFWSGVNSFFFGWMVTQFAWITLGYKAHQRQEKILVKSMMSLFCLLKMTTIQWTKVCMCVCFFFAFHFIRCRCHFLQNRHYYAIKNSTVLKLTLTKWHENHEYRVPTWIFFFLLFKLLSAVCNHEIIVGIVSIAKKTFASRCGTKKSILKIPLTHA